MPPLGKFMRMARPKDTFKKNKGCLKTFAKFMFSHVGLLLIVCLYAVGGAYILIALELPAEEARRDKKKRVSMDMLDATNYIINYMWYQNTQNHTLVSFKKEAMKNLDLFHNFVVAKASNKLLQYDGDIETWEYDWNFPKSLLFTVTTMSAIGYGHITPKTFYGQIFTILYGVIGLPLLLLFLANIGDFLASSFKYSYSRLCCRWCRIRRKVAELKKNKTLEKKVLWKEDIGPETYMPTDELEVPVILTFCLIAAYLMLGGALFSYLEGWEMHSAAYFTLITLATIGFGDFVPGESFTTSGTLKAALKMTATVVFSLFGMALLSMSINLVQMQLVNKARWAAKELGLSGDNTDPREKYNIKKSQPGTVIETPPHRDGNKQLALTSTGEGSSTTVKPRPSGKVRSKGSNLDDLKLSDIRE